MMGIGQLNVNLKLLLQFKKQQSGISALKMDPNLLPSRSPADLLLPSSVSSCPPPESPSSIGGAPTSGQQGDHSVQC
ncbi:hypothetical protein AMECASPLE_036384 [Ameca splendens]|uniref:Uncharacterized protein n=1 Tax=Ameca splendens TaxID=208324 RepID=A0ABV0YUX1_9TELE